MSNVALPLKGLWLPRKKKGQALKSMGYYRPVQKIQIMARADVDRRATHAVIAFPLENLAYVVDDADQLRGIIAKLQTLYDQITAKGQGKVLDFDSRYEGGVYRDHAN